MEKNKKTLKLPLQFEFAYEIIYISTVIILIGLAYVFASNLLRINVFTILFAILAAILIYFKWSSYILIEKDTLQLVYFKYNKSEIYHMEEINECVFYERKRLVRIKFDNNRFLRFYISEKNKQRFMNWIVNNYPDISCLYISQNEKNS